MPVGPAPGWSEVQAHIHDVKTSRLAWAIVRSCLEKKEERKREGRKERWDEWGREGEEKEKTERKGEAHFYFPDEEAALKGACAQHRKEMQV